MARGAVPAGTQLVWEQAEKRLEVQIRQGEGLDTKAGALVAVHALAAGLIATTAGHFHGAARWVVIATVVGLLVSAGFAIAAFRIVRFDGRPAPEAMWRFAEWPDDEILHRLLSTRFDALAINRVLLTRKGRYIFWSLTVLSVVALVVATSAIVGLVRSA